MKTASPVPRVWETILVVDEEFPKPRVVRFTLERQGYKVLEAEKQEARRLLREQPAGIDLLVASIPEELIPRCPKVPVLYISARPDENFVRSTHQTPLRMLRKPFARDGLIAKVRDVLGRREAHNGVRSV